MKKGLKIFLIFLIVVVFGAIGYYLLSGEDISSPLSNTSSPLTTTTGAPVSGLAPTSTSTVDADQIGQEFLAQLLNIRSIKLREDIFSSPSFLSLTDFTIELIQAGNEGRINPFAPFGADEAVPLAPDAGSTSGDGSTGSVFFGPGSVTPVTPPASPLTNS